MVEKYISLSNRNNSAISVHSENRRGVLIARLVVYILKVIVDLG